MRLVKSMMRKDARERPTAKEIWAHRVVANARRKMERALAEVRAQGDERPETLFKVSPLAGVDAGFLGDILGCEEDMDCSGF